MAASLPGVSLFVGLCADPDRLSLAQVLCSRIFPVQELELTEKEQLPRPFSFVWYSASSASL